MTANVFFRKFTARIKKMLDGVALRHSLSTQAVSAGAVYLPRQMLYCGTAYPHRQCTTAQYTSAGDALWYTQSTPLVSEGTR